MSSHRPCRPNNEMTNRTATTNIRVNGQQTCKHEYKKWNLRIKTICESLFLAHGPCIYSCQSGLMRSVLLKIAPDLGNAQFEVKAK
jgi:hypothetical protein